MSNVKAAAFSKLEQIIREYCTSLKHDADFQAFQDIIAQQRTENYELRMAVDDIIEAVGDVMKNGGDLRAKVTKILLRP